MNWMNKLEKKFGRYAIPNITMYLVIAYIIGMILVMTPLGGIVSYLKFDAYRIFHGQIWRLLTWVFVPMTSNSILGLIFMLCVLSFSRTLEMIFGSFKMNVYIIGGILLYDVLGILVYGVARLIFGNVIVLSALINIGFPTLLSPYYILLSLFMLLAICMPNAEVRLWFVLPIKMKWMLVFYFLDLGYELFTYFRMGWQYGLFFGSQIIFALINLGLFVLFSKTRRTMKQVKRQREFKAQFKEPRPGSGITSHKCAICGRTEQDDPSLTFRYCSKCNGAREYCQDHLFTHTHVTGDFSSDKQVDK